MGSDPQYAKYPNLTLAQDIFNLSNPSCSLAVQQTSLKKLQTAIGEHKMAPLYRYLAHPVEGILNSTGEGLPQHAQHGNTKPVITSNMLATKKLSKKVDLPWDEKLYESLVEENKKELEAYQKEEEEAAEAAGDTEVQAARGKRAELWARVGDKVRILETASPWYRILTVHVSTGQGYHVIRGRAREDRYTWHQDRSGPGDDPGRIVLWRPSICEEAGRAGKCTGGEWW